MAPQRRRSSSGGEEPGGELYKMATFTKLTGLSPEVLRAWERRHGLLEPERSSGGHRAYTERDLTVIERVRVLLAEGRSIGEIARMGRKRLLEEQQRVRVVMSSPLVSPEALRDRLVEAASRLDEREIQLALDEAFALSSPLATVEQVIVPVARRVGDLWEKGILTVASEHLISTALRFRLRKLIELASTGPRSGQPVICACFPDESHELGLLILALRLAGAGRRVSYLGHSLPAGDLDKAISTLLPRAVCLSVTMAGNFSNYRLEIAAVARRHRETTRFLVGGPAAPEKDSILTRAGVDLWPASREELPGVV